MQKDLTEVKIFQKSFRGGGLLYWNPCIFSSTGLLSDKSLLTVLWSILS